MQAVVFILISLAITTAVLSAIFFTAWSTMGRQAHAYTWGWTFVFGTLQWCGNLLQGFFLSWEAYWLTVNALSMITVSLGVKGHCQRLNFKISAAQLWVPAALAYSVIVWFTVVDVHVGIRTGTQALYTGLVIGAAAYLVLTRPEKLRPAEWGAGLSMVFFSAAQLMAATMALRAGVDGDPAFLQMYSSINYITMPGAFTAMAMFIVFVLASDLAEEMKQVAVRDQLTGLFNRRGFMELAEPAFASSQRTDRTLSVIMTDIDRFKSINDQYGHKVGDRALQHFANILLSDRRGEDIAARIGGEEFALILPGTGAEDAVRIADALCNRLADSEIAVGGDVIRMTASFGVAAISNNDAEFADMLTRADSALYRSKRAGRNRIDIESSQMLMNTQGALKPIS
ncbi:MAG: GGDEF domain-containing protein [Pseudomonadota bacterium]